MSRFDRRSAVLPPGLALLFVLACCHPSPSMPDEFFLRGYRYSFFCGLFGEVGPGPEDILVGQGQWTACAQKVTRWRGMRLRDVLAQVDWTINPSTVSKAVLSPTDDATPFRVLDFGKTGGSDVTETVVDGIARIDLIVAAPHDSMPSDALFYSCGSFEPGRHTVADFRKLTRKSDGSAGLIVSVVDAKVVEQLPRSIRVCYLDTVRADVADDAWLEQQRKRHAPVFWIPNEILDSKGRYTVCGDVVRPASFFVETEDAPAAVNSIQYRRTAWPFPQVVRRTVNSLVIDDLGKTLHYGKLANDLGNVVLVLPKTNDCEAFASRRSAVREWWPRP